MIDRELNPADYADNKLELEVQRELNRLNIENAQMPEKCPTCGSVELQFSGGYVGEAVILCGDCKTLLWEDNEDAIRRVL